MPFLVAISVSCSLALPWSRTMRAPNCFTSKLAAFCSASLPSSTSARPPAAASLMKFISCWLSSCFGVAPRPARRLLGESRHRRDQRDSRGGKKSMADPHDDLSGKQRRCCFLKRPLIGEGSVAAVVIPAGGLWRAGSGRGGGSRPSAPPKRQTAARVLFPPPRRSPHLPGFLSRL